jgi:hypothetical protein
MFFLGYHFDAATRELSKLYGGGLIMFVLSMIASLPTLLIASLVTYPLNRYKVNTVYCRALLLLLTIAGICFTFGNFGIKEVGEQLLILDYVGSACIAFGLIVLNERRNSRRAKNSAKQGDNETIDRGFPLLQHL